MKDRETLQEETEETEKHMQNTYENTAVGFILCGLFTFGWMRESAGGVGYTGAVGDVAG